MLARTLVDTDEWLVTVNLLSIGAIRATNREGKTVKATVNEKLYLMRVLEAFQKWGIKIGASSPLRSAVVGDFAKAIHSRPKPGFYGGGAAHGRFFSTFDSEETARRYFLKFQQTQSQCVPETVQPAAPKARSSTTRYGCLKCWPESADLAWDARQRLKSEADLVDESHFHLLILRCPDCSQAFLSVFMESIDWKDGDDPQFWSIVPITGPELKSLSKTSPTEGDLAGLASGRRSLFRAAPKGDSRVNRWASGVVLVPHD